jgi:predicted metal-binding protein
MIVEINPNEIEYSKRFQSLCRRPFYGHSHGCPNFGKKESCPPNVPLIDRVLDLNKNIYIIFNKFEVGEFAEKIRKSHPRWKNERQWYNPRYWQPRARKLHKEEQARAKLEKSIDCIINNPEALGVNVTDLMSKIGFNLKWGWPPEHRIQKKEYLQNSVYIISLGGFYAPRLFLGRTEV